MSGGKKGDYQNCSVLYCVLKLCTVISTLVRAVLWIWFCYTGPISLCVDLFVYISVYFVCFSHTAYLLYYCEHSGVDLVLLKPNCFNPSSFIALTLLVGSFDP